MAKLTLQELIKQIDFGKPVDSVKLLKENIGKLPFEERLPARRLLIFFKRLSASLEKAQATRAQTQELTQPTPSLSRTTLPQSAEEINTLVQQLLQQAKTAQQELPKLAEQLLTGERTASDIIQEISEVRQQLGIPIVEQRIQELVEKKNQVLEDVKGELSASGVPFTQTQVEQIANQRMTQFQTEIDKLSSILSQQTALAREVASQLGIERREARQRVETLINLYKGNIQQATDVALQLFKISQQQLNQQIRQEREDRKQILQWKVQYPEANIDAFEDDLETAAQKASSAARTREERDAIREELRNSILMKQLQVQELSLQDRLNEFQIKKNLTDYISTNLMTTSLLNDVSLRDFIEDSDVRQATILNLQGTLSELSLNPNPTSEMSETKLKIANNLLAMGQPVSPQFFRINESDKRYLFDEAFASGITPDDFATAFNSSYPKLAGSNLINFQSLEDEYRRYYNELVYGSPEEPSFLEKLLEFVGLSTGWERIEENLQTEFNKLQGIPTIVTSVSTPAIIRRRRTKKGRKSKK